MQVPLLRNLLMSQRKLGSLPQTLYKTKSKSFLEKLLIDRINIFMIFNVDEV